MGMVFLGAMLLFGLEPLVGRLLLPCCGGAVHVWLTSLMFFQAMLLAGYLYAHLLARKLGRWHLLLLALPLLNLPLRLTARPAPEAPLLTLLGLLLVHFALPFVVLATTAVIAQCWFAHADIGQHTEPYPLYAASNAGSLMALLGYAFVAEPWLGVRVLSLAWTGGYLVYAALVLAAWRTLRPGQGTGLGPAPGRPGTSKRRPQVGDYARWLLLSCLPSMFLSTVTNFIAQEVGSFPMVWVIPLALYLASFVVTFRRQGGLPLRLALLWPAVVWLGFLVYLLPVGLLGWSVALAVPLLVFLATCLVANRELYVRRPPVSHLTGFYLTIALGGFLGGAAISLLAPQLFTGLYEYPLTLAGLAATFWWCHHTAFAACWRQVSPVGRLGLTAAAEVFLAVILVLGSMQWRYLETACKFRHRNFYGLSRVLDEPLTEGAPAMLRKLVHGNTGHGSQLLDPNQSRTPTSYYHLGSPFAEVAAITLSPRRLAVVGLGAGVVSAYTRPDDTLTYYEIDPDNEEIARTWFTFLRDSQGQVRVKVGDGRLSLQDAAATPGEYGLIFVDAFSGDAIPAHLLTREALATYLARLEEHGLILFHLSNRYYDFRAVVKATAALLHLCGAMNIPPLQSQLRPYQAPSQCLVLARHPDRLEPLLDRGWVRLGPGDGLTEASPWTDDYINILSPLWAKLRPR